MPRRAPRYCIIKGQWFYGHLTIPGDARHALNQNQFMVPLHVPASDPVGAAAAVAPLVVEWKARIKAVRQGLHDPLRDEIDRLAAEFRKLNEPLDDAGAALVVRAIDFAFQRVGGSTSMAQHKALADARGDVLTALHTAPHATKAINAMRQIAGADGAHTPFLTHAERWHATLRKSATSDRWLNILREFDEAVGQPLERLNGGHVQGWFDDLLGAGKSPATVRFRRLALSTYWQWMGSRELVDGEKNPFAGRKIKSRQTKIERAKSAKAGFPPSEVPRLWQTAEEYGDHDLSYASQLSAWMGWRLEEAAQLKATDVHQMAGVTYISGGLKSEAGLRTLPVPSAIVPLVAKLAQRKDADGYLIRSTANNKWQLRGSVIGQRFSRLKTRLGYDRRRSFHSLRHTYASMLSAAGVPLAVIRDLMGHASDGNVTLDYIDESTLRERLVWLDRAIKFTPSE
jgi:integrase